MGKVENDEVQPKAGKINDVGAGTSSNGVTVDQIKTYYTENAVNYEQVAEHFNVRVYDVRKILDADFAADPDVEAGIKEVD